MKIRLTRGVLAVPAGAVGQALAFTVQHWPNDGHNANSDEVIFNCSFDGYPGLYNLTWTSIESVY